jgi:hypothetical protein
MSDAKNIFNFAENRFIDYCNSVGYLYRRLGYNSIDSLKSTIETNIPLYSKIPTIAKLTADFFVYKAATEANKQEQFFVSLKQSNKIKLRDLKKYIVINELYTNRWTKFTICFPLKDKIRFLSVEQLLRMLPDSKLKTFQNDGVEYFEINV